MIRSLPKNLPLAVIAAADGVLSKRVDIESRRSDALASYHAQMRLNYLQTEPLDDQRAVERADALFEWGMMLREAMPVAKLRQGFKSGEASSLALVSQQISLRPETAAAGGSLRVRLELEFEDPSILFRYYAWFNGYRVVGGAGLNSATALQMALHAEMLRQIHDRVAEGDVWTSTIHNLWKINEILTDS